MTFQWTFRCDDCGNFPDAPMLKDEVWASIAYKKACLCIGCTVVRMGRPITLADLKRCPANEPVFYFANQTTQKQDDKNGKDDHQ